MHTSSQLFKKLSTLSLTGVFLFLLSGTANAQTCPDDMSHYWKLNETGTPTTFYDSYVETNNAYCDTDCPVPATGIVNGAQYFDGIDDEISVDDDGAPGTFDWGAGDSFSIELWMHSNNLPGNRVIVGRDDGSIHWWVGSMSGSAAFCLYTSGDGVCVTGGNALDDNLWHHIVAVRDGTVTPGVNRIYVDGELINSEPHTYTSGFGSSTELNIGHLNNGYRYNGSLDEVAIYDRTLTETEITNHYNASYYLGRGYCNICSTPVNIMPLGDSITEGGASGAVPDEQGYWVSYRGYLWDSLNDNGYAVDLLGDLSSGYEILDDPDHEGHGGMPDEWFPENVYSFLENNDPDVVLMHIGTCYPLNDNPAFVGDTLDEIDQYEADYETTVTVILARIVNRLCCSDVPPCIECATTTSFNNNIAVMAQARIENGDKIIIVDMEYDAGIDYAEQPDGDMWDNLHPYETGYEKMAAVWYDALTSFLPGCTPTPPTIISTPVTEATVSWLYAYDVDATGYPAPTYDLTQKPDGMTINPNTGLIEWTPAAGQEGPNDVVVIVTNGVDPDDTQPFTIHVNEAPSCPQDMTHYWKLDETGSPTDFLDYFLGTNNATCDTDCPTPATGIVNGAQYFDGSNDEVNVDDDGTFDWGVEDSFSIELWMHSNNLPGNRVIVGRDDGSIHWWVGSMSGSAAFCLYILPGDGVCVTGGDALDDEIWHHIVAVRDNSVDENRIYVDGVLTASAPHTYTTGFGSSTELNVGHLNNNYRYNGILDEVALWNKALTIEEIEAHYNSGFTNGLGYCEGCLTDDDCDDGVYCNGEEICDSNNLCQPGTPPDCDDGVDCTDDSCDPGTDSCLNEPNDVFCDNGDWCDGIESCDPLLGCQDGTPVDCDDGVGCTIDSCDEVNDQCVNNPDDAFCDNGDWCDGTESCDSVLDCQDGTLVDCDDGVGCTVDSCDEVNDQCVSNPDDDLCDNGDWCDGAESCDPLLGCQDGTPVNCNDGKFCNGVEYCDEDNDICESPGNPCPWLCDEENDSCHTPNPTTTTSIPVPICDVVIVPFSETVESGGTIEFIALTACDDVEVEGNYEWTVISTIGSSIDENTGFYTAGENNTDSDVADTIRVTDIANGDITANASVTVEKKGQPPVCNTTIEPSAMTIDSGETMTFTATIPEGEGCPEPDYTWQIDTDIHSEITPSVSSCFYQAGINRTGMLVTDTITIIDNANGTVTEAKVTILYGRIVGVFPDVLLSSRLIPLFHVMIIIGEDTCFNSTSRIIFTPDDAITTIGQIGLGNMMGVLVMISRNSEAGTVDLAVTTTNGEGQEVTFRNEDPFKINLLPFILDEG